MPVAAKCEKIGLADEVTSVFISNFPCPGKAWGTNAKRACPGQDRHIGAD